MIEHVDVRLGTDESVSWLGGSDKAAAAIASTCRCLSD